jgi:arabinofuranosyltransferase
VSTDALVGRRVATLTGPLPDLLRRRASVVTAVVLGLTVLAFAVLVLQRRWISDDGLIFLRTVRQILAGNGPVFNVGERVEANTSTLWTVVLLGLALVPGVPLELLSIGAGLVLAVGALALALDASRRFVGLGRIVVPAGALVVLAVPPFWDFGTSGLETSLSWFWLAAVWWLLVVRSQRAPQLFAAVRRRPGRAWPTALVIGLGPLVRPDLAVVAAVAGLALLVLEQPRHARAWGRMAGLVAVAVALPVAYEVFRAGYYGLLVPATALAKEASIPRWGRGLVYLRDFVGPSWLVVPALALTVAAVGLAHPPLWRLRPRGG